MDPRIQDVEFIAYSLAGAACILAGSFVRKERDKYLSCCVALALPVAAMVISVPQKITAALHPATMDAWLLHLDHRIGLDPQLLITFAHRWLWMFILLRVVYQAIPLAIGLAYAAERSMLLIKTLLISSALAFVCYNIIPAVGPEHALTPEGYARNCMPSMHFGWALLIAWSLRNPYLKAAAWVFVVLTGLATIGLGEHYFVDLIVAVPFCYAVFSSSALIAHPRRNVESSQSSLRT